MRWSEQQYREDAAKRARWQRGGEVADTLSLGAPTVHAAQAVAHLATNSTGPLTLPWPPSGQHAHFNVAGGRRVLRPEIIAYRDGVAALCYGREPIVGPYRIHYHFSPGTARAVDPDNLVKTVSDALVGAGYVEGDSFKHVREILVTTDDERLGHVRVTVRPYVAEAA